MLKRLKSNGLCYWTTTHYVREAVRARLEKRESEHLLTAYCLKQWWGEEDGWLELDVHGCTHRDCRYRRAVVPRWSIACAWCATPQSTMSSDKNNIAWACFGTFAWLLAIYSVAHVVKLGQLNPISKMTKLKKYSYLTWIGVIYS